MLGPTFSQEIDNVITNLRNNVAAGEDDIKTLPLKRISPPINLVLSRRVNQMLSTEIFSNKFKIARVSPVHKGSIRVDLKNYRSKSVLLVLSKIFEEAINAWLN